MRDTIFALATASGRAAIAVVRLSGPASGQALVALAGKLPAPRVAAVRVLTNPGRGRRLDQALVLWFPGPASFTGEDQVELHLHGGRAVIDAVCEALAEAGLRPAEPGEFTRRAFENGKLSLLEAEGVADLIDAETEGQRRQALDQMQGALRGREALWRGLLLEALALLEASIDFPDEDVPGGVVDQARCSLVALSEQLQGALSDARGERVREGLRVAILGRPNAGKSSLLNGIARREAAIVAASAGTTRDVIEVPLDLAGYRVLLADTAGLRAATDAVEAEGVRRALAWAGSADLRLFVIDASAPGPAFGEAEAALAQPGDALVLNKMDKAAASVVQQGRGYAAAHGLEVVETSASLGKVDQAVRFLQDRVVGMMQGAEVPAVTRLRHREALGAAQSHLQRALAPDRATELMAEDVRLASRVLAGLSGRIGSEDVLDKVFGAFCIGK